MSVEFSVSCFVLHTCTPISDRFCETLVQDWRDHLTEMVGKAKARARRQSMLEEHGHGLLYYRAKCRNLYEHTRTQYCVAVLIILAFAVDIGEAQLLPQGCVENEVSCGPIQENVLQPLFTFAEIILTSLFTLELLVNILSKSNDYFRPLWSHFENIFDAMVVVVSIFSLVTKLAGIDSVPNIKMFRLVRVFRVVRLFKRFKSLNRIIMASHVKAPLPAHVPRPRSCPRSPDSGCSWCASPGHLGLAAARRQRALHPAHLHVHLRRARHASLQQARPRAVRQLPRLFLHHDPGRQRRCLGQHRRSRHL